MWAILPASRSSTSAPTDSVNGTSGSGVCSWYRSIPVDLQPPEALVAHLPQPFRASVDGQGPLTGLSPARNESALGGHQQILRVRVQGISDYPLAGTVAVDVGGVDELHAQLGHPPDQLHRVRRTHHPHGPEPQPVHRLAGDFDRRLCTHFVDPAPLS